MGSNLKLKTGAQHPKLGVKKSLIRIASAIQAALFPTRCLVCGSFFQPKHHEGIQWTYKNLQDILHCLKFQTADSSQKRLAEDNFFNRCFEILFAPILCPICLSGFEPLESPFCIKCGIMFHSRQDDDHFCGDCLTQAKRFSTARAPGVYNRTLMAVIHCYKYRGKIQLALPLGALLLATLMRYWDWNSIDMVIPVPLHISRLRRRGFNQALLLIRDWNRMAKDLNVGLSEIQIERDVLTKNRRTDSQTGLARNLRMTNIKNAFSIKDPLKIEDKRILVVDDVYTTGATVDACAAELLNNGAQTVDVLTLARAM